MTSIVADPVPAAGDDPSRQVGDISPEVLGLQNESVLGSLAFLGLSLSFFLPRL